MISGATGFIGKQLSMRLLTAGFNVSALYRSNNRPEHLPSPAISWLRSGDLATTAIDPAIGAGIDVFINLAATLRPSPGNLSETQSETVAIARNVRRFVAEAGIPHLIAVSSIAGSIADRDPTNARRYGREKLAADKIFLEPAQKPCKVIILRPPAIYGPSMQNSLSMLAKMVRRRLPIPLGAATAPRHYMSVQNLCDLIETIIRSDDQRWTSAAGHIFEPSDGQAIATRDLVRMMGTAMGRAPCLVPVPLTLLRTLGTLTGRSEMISGAIDQLDVTPAGELEAAFGWRPFEQMPESLNFLAQQFSPA